MAIPGRIPRATDDLAFHQCQNLFAHEAAAHWPPLADTISLRSLNLVAHAGRDVWGRTHRAQPLSLSITVALRSAITSAAAGDALDASTVHYGVLSKNVVAALADAQAGRVWLDGLAVASRVSEAVVATAAGAVGAVRMVVGFPKGSTLGKGAGVEWTVWYGEGQRVVGWGRQMFVRDVGVPVLIGVNENERMKKQLVVVSVWVDKVSDAAVDQYHVVEDLVLKAVETTEFETLEALAEKVARDLCDKFLNGESSGASLRIRIEKPTAVPLADAPAIEIYRTHEQILRSRK